jgi:hypothetical protein
VKRWLITTSDTNDLQDLRRTIVAHGGAVADEPPIPLDAGQQVLEAEGPDDLPDRLREHPAVIKVSPDTPKHPYA